MPQHSTQLEYYSYVDLTCLDPQATLENIHELCETAKLHQVAAICIEHQWLPFAQSDLSQSSIKLATVANFPSGDASLELQIEEIEKILSLNPHEIDWVFPYKKFIHGDEKIALRMADKIREVIPSSILLKVILETGAFSQFDLLESLCFSLIDMQVDFLKTSTGKIAEGVTLEKSEILLNAIAKQQAKKKIGFKASGGIRSLAQIKDLFDLVEKKMGKEYLSPKTFRLGMSCLP